jgi:hypothetical protein
MFVLNVIGKGAAPGLFTDLASGAPVILSPGFAFDLPVVGTGTLTWARDLARGLKLDINPSSMSSVLTNLPTWRGSSPKSPPSPSGR